jgi:hypothetical protein
VGLTTVENVLRREQGAVKRIMLAALTFRDRTTCSLVIRNALQTLEGATPQRGKEGKKEEKEVLRPVPSGTAELHLTNKLRGP